jgi:hypothetical protein
VWDVFFGIQIINSAHYDVGGVANQAPEFGKRFRKDDHRVTALAIVDQIFVENCLRVFHTHIGVILGQFFE